MKSFIKLISLMMIVLSLSACGVNEPDADSLPTSPEALYDKLMQEYYEKFSINYGNYFGTSDYDDYLFFSQLIKQSTEIAKPFVDYESIDHFGVFSHFGWGHGDSYMYRLKDSSGNDFSIYIDNAYISIDSRPEANVNLADMRRIDSTVGGIYMVAGILYNYNEYGILNKIEWYDSRHRYYLTDDLTEHPLDDSVLGQLLSIEGKTAEELWALINGEQ